MSPGSRLSQLMTPWKSSGSSIAMVASPLVPSPLGKDMAVTSSATVPPNSSVEPWPTQPRACAVPIAVEHVVRHLGLDRSAVVDRERVGRRGEAIAADRR